MIPLNTILNMNCRDGLHELPDNVVDACVTDPPYGIKFMGRRWDYEIPPVEVWKGILRVLKPGAHMSEG
jgi:site-specific DNA-methyltransferase (adenine-specific)